MNRANIIRKLKSLIDFWIKSHAHIYGILGIIVGIFGILGVNKYLHDSSFEEVYRKEIQENIGRLFTTQPDVVKKPNSNRIISKEIHANTNKSYKLLEENPYMGSEGLERSSFRRSTRSIEPCSVKIKIYSSKNKRIKNI